MAKSKPLTLLKSLDGQAVTFDVPVELQRLDGSRAKIVFHCQAFGKRAWAQAQQRHMDALRAREEALDADGGDEAAPKRLDEQVDAAIVENAKLVREFATGWSLSDPFTQENLEDLEDRFGGTLAQLAAAYDRAVYQGQLGN